MILRKNILYLTALLTLAGLGACVKTDFDEPPPCADVVEITANTSIKDLKAKHVTPEGFDLITDDLIIGGVVVMDDESGNYYKTLVIEDSTGGIEVRFNDAFQYNQFPIGRKMFIRCQGLYLTDYAGLTQLTGSLIEENGQLDDVGLTEFQVRTKIVRGSACDIIDPQPKVVTIADLNPNLLSTLIRLEDVQFAKADTNKTFADAVTQNSLNRTLEDCNGLQTILRTSGFANFAAQRTPTGKGHITGVLGVFNGTYQLYIRDMDDVEMTGDRCGQTGGGVQLIDINVLRSLYTGSTGSAPANRKIKGMVISDRANKNLNDRNLFIQDGTAGIVVRFAANHSFNLGDEVEIDVSEQELSEFNGLLQVNNVPLANAALQSTGNTLTPRTATIAEINANFNQWESTLVTIVGATLSGAGSPISGSKTVTDATGSIPMFTQSYAAFANSATPSGTLKVTGILSDFNGKQIILRNMGDLQP